MTPDDKERLVLALKDSGRTCMMCGDGANDVGALKQAQVGGFEQGETGDGTLGKQAFGARVCGLQPL